MNRVSLSEALRHTLADRRLSRGERKAVQAMIADQLRSEQHRDVLRHEAFELARQELQNPNDKQVLQWLEDVVKALEPPDDSPRAPRCEAYFEPGDNCPRRIISLFHSCRRTADVCVFTITDDRVTEAIEAAHARGVKVRIISDNDKTMDAGSDIWRLRRRGIEVRVDISPFHMHHKFAVIDGRTLITGSYNWTRGAAEKNHENLVLLEEPPLVAEFLGEFEKIWENSTPLRLD